MAAIDTMGYAATATADGGFLLVGWKGWPRSLDAVRADAAGSSGCLETEFTPVATPITDWTVSPVTILAADVTLAVGTPATAVGEPATQSQILCSDAMAWRLSLPLIRR
jgi:hypothetical protein